MPSKRWAEIEAIFLRLLERAPSEWARLVDEACAGDVEMREEVLSLLASHRDAGGFLERPALEAFDVSADLLADTAPGEPGRLVFAPDQLVAGRFEVTRFVARGGMGEVYEAWDRELQEPVALKTVRPSLARDESALRRFKREIKVARMVTHPNVCRSYDVFHHGGDAGGEGAVTFLSMELLAGETLAEVLRRGPMSVPAALGVIPQIASGLRAAHEAGIVHRDLKPGNVILVPTGKDVRAVITDFGVALPGASPPGRSSGAGREDGAAATPRPVAIEVSTGRGAVPGTPDYMSPEQARGEELDAQSDIFSFGLILYEMLTGQLPYRAAPGVAPEDRYARDPAPPSELNRSVTERIERVVLKCLQPDRARRYRSALEVLRDLEPDRSLRSRARALLARRGKLLAAAGALAAAAVAAAFLGGLLDALLPAAVRRANPFHTPAVVSYAGRSSSAEAMAAFQVGLERLRWPAYMEAARYLEEAAAADPDFAMAQVKLAEAWLNAGRAGPARAALERARQLAASAALPPAERLQLDAVVARLEGDEEAAIGAQRSLLELYPDDPDVLLGLASSLERLGDTARATAVYRSALEAPVSKGAALLGLSRGLVITGRAGEAVSLLQKAVEDGEFHDSPEALALGHIIAGVAHRDREQFDEALAEFEAALHYYELAGDRSGQARALGNMGTIHHARYEPAEALEVLTKSLEIAREIASRRNLASSLHTLGMVHEMTGDLDSAVRAVRQSTQLHLEAGNHVNLAINLDTMARLHIVRGQLIEAAVFLEQASSHVGYSNDELERGYNLMLRGSLKRLQGQYPAAAGYLESAIEVFRRFDQREDIADLETSLAEIDALQGRYGEAYRRLTGVLASDTLPAAELAATRVRLVRLARALGQTALARAELRKVRDAIEGEQLHPLRPLALLAEAELQHSLRRGEDSLAALDRAAREAERSGRRVLAIEARLAAGKARLDQGRHSEARELLRRTREEASQLGLPHLEAEASVALARMHLAGDELRAAREAARHGVGLAAALSERPVLLGAYTALGEASRRLGREDEAADAFGEAAGELAWLRQQVAPEHLDSYLTRPDVRAVLAERGGRREPAAAPGEPR